MRLRRLFSGGAGKSPRSFRYRRPSCSTSWAAVSPMSAIDRRSSKLGDMRLAGCLAGYASWRPLNSHPNKLESRGLMPFEKYE